MPRAGAAGEKASTVAATSATEGRSAGSARRQEATRSASPRGRSGRIGGSAGPVVMASSSGPRPWAADRAQGGVPVSRVWREDPRAHESPAADHDEPPSTSGGRCDGGGPSAGPAGSGARPSMATPSIHQAPSRSRRKQPGVRLAWSSPRACRAASAAEAARAASITSPTRRLCETRLSSADGPSYQGRASQGRPWGPTAVSITPARPGRP